jgi:hypothetical protein
VHFRSVVRSSGDLPTRLKAIAQRIRFAETVFRLRISIPQQVRRTWVFVSCGGFSAADA